MQCASICRFCGGIYQMNMHKVSKQSSLFFHPETIIIITIIISITIFCNMMHVCSDCSTGNCSQNTCSADNLTLPRMCCCTSSDCNLCGMNKSVSMWLTVNDMFSLWSVLWTVLSRACPTLDYSLASC